ncbi:MAG: hypothetical protein WA705_23580 [Candidatus Ozemobacteraceae bacterium]
MKIDRKNMGLVLVSFIALSFNSHFAQAAKKTQEIFRPAKVYAFKLDGEKYTPLAQVKASPVTVKKTAIRFDRSNMIIGGYVVNSSDRPVNHVRIFPTFLNGPADVDKLTERLNHDELNLAAKELRRFVIMRPIAEMKTLLESNIPIADNCILNCQVL